MPDEHSTRTASTGPTAGPGPATPARRDPPAGRRRRRRSGSPSTWRAARSTSMPWRASWWSRRPPTLTADTIGGICQMVPVSCGRGPAGVLEGHVALVPAAGDLARGVQGAWWPRRARSRPRSTSAARSGTAAAGWPGPSPTSRTPVASGSRVPAWPTFFCPNSRRQRATTSWLVIPAGLSTTARPSITGPGPRRSVGDSLGGSGRLGRGSCPQDVLDAVAGGDGRVGREAQLRRPLEPNLLRDGGLEANPRLGQDAPASSSSREEKRTRAWRRSGSQSTAVMVSRPRRSSVSASRSRASASTSRRISLTRAAAGYCRAGPLAGSPACRGPVPVPGAGHVSAPRRAASRAGWR